MGWLASIEFDLRVSLPGDDRDGEQEKEFNEDTAEALEVPQVISKQDRMSILIENGLNILFFYNRFDCLPRWKGKRSGNSR